MGLVNIFKTVMKNNLNRNREKPVANTSTPTPLGAHQGSVVTLPDLDFALAQAYGSICLTPKNTMVVSAVGKYTLWNMDVYHCYFGYKGVFLQLVTKTGSMNVEQARFFNLRSEIQPTTAEEWEFWLGSWMKDEQGEFIRDDKGIAIKKEDGLIGFPQFQIDNVPPIVYDREWVQGPTSTDPIKITERVIDVAGHIHYIKYEAMEYSRKLSTTDPIKVESLLVSVVEDDTSTSVNIFIGVPVDHTAIKILVS